MRFWPRPGALRPPSLQGHVHRERDLQALYRGFKDTSSVVAAELRAVTSDWDAARRKFEGTPAAPAPAQTPGPFGGGQGMGRRWGGGRRILATVSQGWLWQDDPLMCFGGGEGKGSRLDSIHIRIQGVILPRPPSATHCPPGAGRGTDSRRSLALALAAGVLVPRPHPSPQSGGHACPRAPPVAGR